jgi:type II secretory pathway predicted ATPase ExeA
MYVSHFGLHQSPFRTAPDPEYFFGSGLHLTAVNRVVHAIRERAGLVLVMGGIGQGKTTVCRYIQTRYRDEFVMGYLGNPFLDVQGVARQILLEFGLGGEVGGSGDMVRVLAAFLKEQDRQGRVVVLFLDEAHLLSPDVLELLLIVTNIQYRGRHLLQMVLAGQNEFQETLRQPRFASLNQRLGNRVLVTDLTRVETAEYIRFRLDQAGGSAKKLFTPSAVTKIWKITRGNPRLINQVCERLLQGAYERRVEEVVPRDVDRLCHDPVFEPLLFPDKKRGEQCLWGPALVGAALVLCLVGFSSTIHKAPPPAMRVVPGITASSLDDSEKNPTGSGSLAGRGADRATPSEVEAKLEEILQLLAKRELAESPTTSPDHQAAAVFSGQNNQAGKTTGVRPARSGKYPVRASTRRQAQTRKPLLSSSPEIQVHAIVWDPLPRFRLAVVNEHIVKQGDLVGRGYRVEAIGKNSIRLVKDGRMFENRVHGTGKKP